MINTIVLIPHYNNLASLNRTLKSIYHTQGIDLLIIDDGSVNTMLPDLAVLQKGLNANVNLELLKLDKNGGIANALNTGLEYILKNKKHKFIARIDCGDVCVSKRFEIQENYLIKHQDIALVGSWVKWIDYNGKVVFCKKPSLSHKNIKRRMAVRCSLIHPSVMFRYSIVEELGMYPEEYEAAEDYAFFYKIVKRYKVANISEFLTSVEHADTGISNVNRKIQSWSKLKVIYAFSPLNFNFIYGTLFNLTLMAIGSNTSLKIKRKLFNDNNTRS
jgi:glycosyltransferase involved in cell wall biosynthesis